MLCVHVAWQRCSDRPVSACPRLPPPASAAPAQTLLQLPCASSPGPPTLGHLLPQTTSPGPPPSHHPHRNSLPGHLPLGHLSSSSFPTPPSLGNHLLPWPDSTGTSLPWMISSPDPSPSLGNPFLSPSSPLSSLLENPLPWVPPPGPPLTFLLSWPSSPAQSNLGHLLPWTSPALNNLCWAISSSGPSPRPEPPSLGHVLPWATSPLSLPPPSTTTSLDLSVLWATSQNLPPLDSLLL